MEYELKKAEKNEAIILRLVESVGQRTSAQVRVEGNPPRQIDFVPYEIKMFKMTRDGQTVKWQETNLLED